MKIILKQPNIDRFLLVVLFAACVILPFSFVISNIFLLVFGGLTFLKSVYLKSYPKKEKLHKFLITPGILFGFALIGTVFSPYSIQGLDLARKYIPLFVLSLAFIFAPENFKKQSPPYIKKGIIVGIAGSFLVLFFHLVTQFILSGETEILRIFAQEYTYLRFVAPLKIHPTYLSVLVIMANCFIYQAKDISNYLKLSLYGLNTLGLLFTMSRIGILLFAVQVIIWFFTLSKKYKVIFSLSTLFVILIGFYIYKTQLRNFYILQRFSLELFWDLNTGSASSTINNRETDDSRTARWSAILKTIKEKPVSGYGTGSEKIILNKTYEKNGLLISKERQYNTHNQFLFYLLENGIIGLLFVLYFFTANFILALKKKQKTQLFFLITLFIVCLFENYFYRATGILTVSLFLTFLKSNNE